MPHISITEREFHQLASAAMKLWAMGNRTEAVVVDEVARRANRALSVARLRRDLGPLIFSRTAYGPPPESPLEAAGLRPKRVRK